MRRTNQLRKEANKKFSAKRAFNVPDYENEKKEAEQEIAAIEETRDQTWEDFLSMYTEHIEKKIDPNLRTGGRRDRDLNNTSNIVEEHHEDDEALLTSPSALVKKGSSQMVVGGS